MFTRVRLTWPRLLPATLGTALVLTGCGDDQVAESDTASTSSTSGDGDGDSATGDGDGDTAGDGDGDGGDGDGTGDGDGDGDGDTAGDGDGDSTGDGDGDTTGDGDGDTTGDGDGDGDPTGDGDGDTTGDGDGDMPPGDGDGDMPPGDGDGDMPPGDGDGDMPPGDGDGDEDLVCDDIQLMYAATVQGATECEADDECKVLNGHCFIGLGGCWYIVNDTVGQAELDAFAQQWSDKQCFGPVCACVAPPNNVGCVDGFCDAL